MRAAERAYGLRVANARGRDGAGQQASAEQRRPEGRRWQPAEQQRWSRPAVRVWSAEGGRRVCVVEVPRVSQEGYWAV